MNVTELFKKFDINKNAYGGVLKLLMFLRSNPTILNSALRGIGENKMTKADLRKIIREEIKKILSEEKPVKSQKEKEDIFLASLPPTVQNHYKRKKSELRDLMKQFPDGVWYDKSKKGKK